MTVETVVGSIMVLVGLILVIFGPRIARARISLHYSYEDLRATSSPVHRRVKRAQAIATSLNLLVGAAFIVFGIRGLIG
jgi:hypothetical protein